MPRKAQRSLPPGGRLNASSGMITLMFRVQESGATRRLSQNKIKADEPRSYADVDAAWEGYHRVVAFIDADVNRAATVGGFAQRWTDPDDPEFGEHGIETPRRSRHAIRTYASHTRLFIGFYADRTLASITEADLKRWTKQPGYKPSAMAAIRTFLSDAEVAGLRSGPNPATGYTRKAQAKLSQGRDERPPVPTAQQSLDVLRHLETKAYPLALWGWFLTGVRTGMRGSEIDGMQLRYLNRETGVYRIDWQLHPVERVLTEPKHGSRRSVLLTPDVMALIDELHPPEDVQVDPKASDFIWTNSFGLPWEDSSRGKWWEKRIAGTTLRELAGGVTMYNATRHYWATQAMASGEITLWNAATLFGHKDGGKLIAKTYARRDEDAALDAVRAMHAKAPADLQTQRARRAA
jgi:integrase